MNQPDRRQLHKSIINEGLRSSDLKNMVSGLFRIDQYKSKMGNDEDIIVVSFKVNDKFPAIDLMEFIEKGYSEVLDADMSSGEETDGKYSVFVEYERNKKFSSHINELIKDLSKLCDIKDWRFKYYKDTEVHEFSKENIENAVPLDQTAYQEKVQSHKISDLSDVLDQGSTEIVSMDENNNFIISKPYSGNLEFKLESIGQYDDIIKTINGPLQLDESSHSQTLFLEKYLGNYEIFKIDNKFLVKSGERAIVISKRGW